MKSSTFIFCKYSSFINALLYEVTHFNYNKIIFINKIRAITYDILFRSDNKTRFIKSFFPNEKHTFFRNWNVPLSCVLFNYHTNSLRTFVQFKQIVLWTKSVQQSRKHQHYTHTKRSTRTVNYAELHSHKNRNEKKETLH